MNIKKKLIQKLPAIAAVCVLWLTLFCILIYPADSANPTAPFFSSKRDSTPKQDEDGYYLLSTKEDFKWFISTVHRGNTETNVRLTGDLILNDTSDWENWEDTPPENTYHSIVSYNGHFDGGGFALEGYYSDFDDADSWQPFLFTTLEEDARISNLHIKNSFFRTSYEDCSYEDDEGETNVAASSALCHANYGLIEGCHVHARVLGAWSAGGIVAINYGKMVDCHFTGSVEAGLAHQVEKPENRLAIHTLFAGGICRTNQGSIRNCTNEGSVTLHTLPENYYINYAAGGITGELSEGGVIEDTENRGDVTCVQLAGGIAGASWSSITRCVNRGSVHVEQADEWEHTSSLICAGICASNGGVIDTCLHTGSATIRQSSLSFYAPIYGIACNTVHPDKGMITNCYYLSENTLQDYRQSGVYKLSAAEAADFSAYLTGEKRMEDIDTWELLSSLPSYPGTDEQDYIRLGLGPASDLVYEVQPGDNLWKIAEIYYGDGLLYPLLERESAIRPSAPLLSGERLTVPHKDYYLLRANDEEGLGWAYCVLPSGESCPTHFIAAKPVDWYYGSMHFEAGEGFEVLWPKDKKQGQDVPAADIRILYRFDGHPEGDFFADWEGVQKSFRRSAKAWCGNTVDSLRFYRYMLDNGEKLYGCSFRLYRQDVTLTCAAFYRIREGFLAEYIGIAPVGEDTHVLERTRYLAAEIDNALTVEETESNCEAFYGRENWDFPLLHNPFATALAYSPEAECSSYMLFTGSQ